MKILYIYSGYPLFYHHLDSWIVSALNEMSKEGIEVMAFSHLQDSEKLNEICKKYQPSIVITILGDKLPKKSLQWLQNQNFTTILWLTEDPYYLDRSLQIIPYFDYVFTIDVNSQEHYMQLGYSNVFHLPLGTNPNIFCPNNLHKTYDLSFIGYPYASRIQFAKLILSETPFRLLLIGTRWRKELGKERINSRCMIVDRWIHPAMASKYYCQTKINLNTLRPMSEPTNLNSAFIANKSVNNRTFDIACCGAFQLKEFVEDLPKQFLEGEEIISFRSEEDLISKINKYMNKEERTKIEQKTRERVLESHTLSHRMRTMLFMYLN